MNKIQSSQPVLKVEGVFKTYGMGRESPFNISNIDFQLAGGEIFRLRGKSGAGKSTIMRIAGLLTLPDSGVVKICGQCPQNWRERDRMRADHIGILFQGGNLFDHLTV